MVTMRVFNTGNGTWIRAWARQSYGSLQRPACLRFDQSGIAVGGMCSCTVGRSSLCAHVICILHQLIHVTKTGNLKLEIQCTNQPQQWHRRGTKGNPEQYTSVNKVTVKSSKSQVLVSRETNTSKKNKSVPMKRNLHEKVERMSEKLKSFKVECHFLLIIGQNKALCKGGLYPLLADRYITQSAEGDHDYLITVSHHLRQWIRNQLLQETLTSLIHPLYVDSKVICMQPAYFTTLYSNDQSSGTIQEKTELLSQ